MKRSSKTPSETSIEMREMVMPNHTNPQNTVFGGTVMSWIDIAAAIAAPGTRPDAALKDAVRHCLDPRHGLGSTPATERSAAARRELRRHHRAVNDRRRGRDRRTPSRS